MQIYNGIKKPTLILDVDRSRKNIQRMNVKAKNQKVRFRPHFKTHQSTEIGTWFREEGVNQITVSSIDMAAYFAKNGWKDITVAFPFNWRQIDEVNELAEHIHLGLLIESIKTIQYLGHKLFHSVDIWIKIDVGAHRTGVDWKDIQKIKAIVLEAKQHPNLQLRGLLTHAGQTYHAHNRKEILEIYQDSIIHLRSIQDQLLSYGFTLEISVGDTPGCSLTEDLGNVDEIRPGNFIFYDMQQLMLSSCSEEDIAVAVACPVVAKHPERNEVIIYGGAIHLSKECYSENGHISYGRIAFPQDTGWSKCVPGAYVNALSQEHGIVRMYGEAFDQVQIGDLLIVLPAHSCLVVSAQSNYLTLTGQVIEMMTGT